MFRFFRCGAYGDETHHRNDLFGVAMQRTRECGAPDTPAQNVIVVGDTELDVAVAVKEGYAPIPCASGIEWRRRKRSLGNMKSIPTALLRLWMM